MNIAAIFALLLNAGVCAQTEFQRADGSALAIMVCPSTAPSPDATDPDGPAEPAPEAAPQQPGKHT
jgi:hypothetical protein